MASRHICVSVLHLPHLNAPLQPHQHQSAGLQPPQQQHVDVTVAFIATGACCLNKSLFLQLQLEADTRRALLSPFIWLEPVPNSLQKQTALLRTSASVTGETGTIFLLTGGEERPQPPPKETANNRSAMMAKTGEKKCKRRGIDFRLRQRRVVSGQRCGQFFSFSFAFSLQIYDL